MTISSTTRKAGPYIGNSATTLFVFAFKVFTTADVIVTLTTIATGAESTLVLDTDYSVTLNADQNASPGGLVSYNPSGSPMTATQKVTITSGIAQLQPVDIVNSGGVYLDVIEAALDRATILVQQCYEKIVRSLKVGVSDTVTGDLPSAVDRASKFLAFDGSGNPIASAGGGSSPVSAAMAPVVSAATLAAARTAMGIAATPHAIADGGTGATTAAQALINLGIGNQSGARNLLYNGDFQFDQEKEGGFYSVGSATVLGPDGWTGIATGAGIFRIQRVADPDNASLFALKFTVNGPDVSIAAGDKYVVQQAIEGYDAARLKAGAADAAAITISFDMKFDVAGVYGISIRNAALNRSYVGTVTQNVGGALESKTVTLTLDLAGTWTYINGAGLWLTICLAAGSTFQAAAGAWGAGNFVTTSAQANFMSSIANVGYIKRIQLESGASATPFEFLSRQAALARCQRYHWKTFAQGLSEAQNAGINTGEIGMTVSTAGVAANTLFVRFPVEMRDVPTIVTHNPGAVNTKWRNRSASADSGANTTFNTTAAGTQLLNAQVAGDLAAQTTVIHVVADARLS